MKYIIQSIQISKDNFTYQIETLKKHTYNNVGMSDGLQSAQFFPTRELSIGDAIKQLTKARINEADIIIQ